MQSRLFFMRKPIYTERNKKLFKALIANDWLVSAVLHVFILMIFAGVYFDAPRQAVSSIVEMFIEPNEQFETVPVAPALNPSSTPLQDQPALEPRREVTSVPATVKTVTQPLSSIPQQNNSEVTAPKTNTNPVLPPTGGNASLDKPAGAPATSSYLSKLKGRIRDSGNGNNGYELDDGEGSITVLKKVLPDTKISDYGKVTLQFQVDSSGAVRSETILPILVDDASYTRDAVAALKQWQFSLKRYNAKQVYKITFIFKPV